MKTYVENKALFDEANSIISTLSDDIHRQVNNTSTEKVKSSSGRRKSEHTNTKVTKVRRRCK